MSKTRILYHATPMTNLAPIMEKGIEPRCDGIIYFCEDPRDCLKFAYIHGLHEVLVCKVRLLSNKVFETFDHNYQFFQCRCWGYSDLVKPEEIVDYIKYEI